MLSKSPRNGAFRCSVHDHARPLSFSGDHGGDQFGGRGRGRGIRPLASEQFVENHAQRINIAGHGAGQPLDLFGTGVLRSQRKVRGHRQSSRLRTPGFRQHFGDSEIQQFRFTFFGDQNIPRF